MTSGWPRPHSARGFCRIYPCGTALMDTRQDGRPPDRTSPTTRRPCNARLRGMSPRERAPPETPATRDSHATAGSGLGATPTLRGAPAPGAQGLGRPGGSTPFRVGTSPEEQDPRGPPNPNRLWFDCLTPRDVVPRGAPSRIKDSSQKRRPRPRTRDAHRPRPGGAPRGAALGGPKLGSPRDTPATPISWPVRGAHRAMQTHGAQRNVRPWGA